jgi:hypothetical protein
MTLAVIGGTLLFAFGSFTPVYPFLYEWIPVLRVMRFPEKYFYLTFALLVFIAVRGLKQVDENRQSNTPWVVAAAMLAAWLTAYVTVRIGPQFLSVVAQSGPGGPSPAGNPATIAAILVILEKQIAISFTLVSLFGLNRLGVLRPALLRPLLVLTLFLDLSSANKPLHFFHDQSLLAKATRIVEKPPVDHGRLFYYPPANNVHPSFMRVAGNPTYEKATEIPLNNLLPNAGMLYGFEYFQDIDALGRRSYTDFLNFINSLPAEQRGKLLRVTNVKYVVAFHALELKGLKLVKDFPEHHSRLYEVLESVPRAYLAARAIHDSDPKSALERMASDHFDPLRDVILDAQIHLETERVGGSATIRLYENNRVQIDAALSAPGVLVLADAFYPGWKAYVNGKEKTIHRANYLFRAVELSAGNHQVEFVYDPVSFKIGWMLSLATASGLLGVPLIGWIRRKKRCQLYVGVPEQSPGTVGS